MEVLQGGLCKYLGTFPPHRVVCTLYVYLCTSVTEFLSIHLHFSFNSLITKGIDFMIILSKSKNNFILRPLISNYHPMINI